MPSKKLIISCGFSELLPVKNIAGIIRGVRDFGEFLEVWVVGDGPERENLEKLSVSLKVKTKFWGRVENKKAREIMRKSDVFVLNSYHEGMPHAMIEALAEGVPVVATKIPAVLEILTDRKNGILVEEGGEGLIRGLRELRDIRGLRKKVINGGRKLYLEKFTWKPHLKSLYNVFDEVAPFASGRSCY
jgi:glycosyltransferase involved in cell wall biosynthesis